MDKSRSSNAWGRLYGVASAGRDRERVPIGSRKNPANGSKNLNIIDFIILSNICFYTRPPLYKMKEEKINKKRWVTPAP